MSKKYPEEFLQKLKKELKRPRKPRRREYTKTEVLADLKPEIEKLRQNGFTLSEIGELIAEQTNGEITASRKSLSVLFKDGATAPEEKKAEPSDTPSSSAANKTSSTKEAPASESEEGQSEEPEKEE